PSIEAGGAFSALARRLGASRLSDNARQVEAWEREALRALREGRTGEAAGDYRRHGRLHLSSSPEPLLQAMVEGWWAARSAGDEAALYAYSREGARVLNRMARARAGGEGRLSGPELVVEAWGPGDLTERSYRAGDEVCCLRNRARLGAGRDAAGAGVRNGTRGTVVAVDTLGGGMTLATRDGRELELPAEYVRRFTDYGYAWTLHKGQGQTVGQSALAVEEAATRRRGRAFVLGAESLSAEAALVAASRATDSTELFVLVDPDDEPETPAAEAESLGRAWARSEHELLALEQLETAREIERLAGGSRDELAGERHALTAMVGAGPPADLRFREEEARHRLGAALVQREEAIVAEQSLRRAGREAEDGEDRRLTREQLSAVLRRRLAVERDLNASADDSRIADEAVLRQARVRRERGSDVRAALDRLEVVDSALASMRRAEIEGLVASPPSYVTGLLGPEPRDRARALRWRQGLVEIEDWRRSVPLAPPEQHDDPWSAALGPPPIEGWDGRRRLRVAGNLRAVRRDLGMDAGPSIYDTASDKRLYDSATSSVIGRRGPSAQAAPRSREGPPAPVRQR
ncbi:MAG TPA: AAA family ATPase, partial [Acidimicrobiales bacterium]|nr:AAA family ATPase [Acidimicrobiales bacterium]